MERRGYPPFNHSLSLFSFNSPRNIIVFGCTLPSTYPTPPSPLAFGNATNTASPGASLLLTPGLHNSCPFFPTTAPSPFIFTATFLFAVSFPALRLRFFGRSSSEDGSGEDSELAAGGEEMALAEGSSSS